MDTDEQLRQEISMLSQLIALNHPSGPALGAVSTSRSRIIPSTLYSPQYYHRQPYQNQRSPSVASHAVFHPGGSGSVPSVSKYRYTKPIQTHPIQEHQKVFAVAGLTSQNVQAEGVVSNGDKSYSGVRNVNPFKLKAIRNTTNTVTTEPSNVTSVPSKVSLPSRTPIPKSVHINPAHLVSSTGRDPLPYPSTSTTSSSFKVRPHINPQHVAYHQICSVPATTVSPAVVATVASSQSDTTYSYKNPTSSRSENQSFSHQDHNLYVTTFGNNREHPKSRTAIKSKYKVDRRLRPSPDKTATTKRALNSRRIKIVKKYWTRLVCHPSSTPLSTSKKSTTFPPKQFHKSWIKPFNMNTSFRPNPKSSIYRTGHPRQGLSRLLSPKKTIVNIGGNNYLRKNSGRTLRKIKPRIPAMVNIGGSQFISKNSGKSLRLFRQSHTSRQKKISLSLSPNLTSGKRLAQRAVFKSKLTLSQRTWRKKRFCVYYNRLGECKKNEEGNCPYIHDKKQLSICPKFVVGKCSIAECKLSHDLKVGRMPPCQFFNKSNCSRENCPYPHIKSTILKKRSPKCEKIKGKEEKKDLQTITGTPRKRKLLTKKDKSSPKNSKTKNNKRQSSGDQEKPKSRYYQQSPDSEPVVSIIPRRIRLDKPTATGPDVTQKLNDGSRQITSLNPTLKEANQFNSSNAEACSTSTSSTNGDAKVLRRARLMQRVSRLQEKVKPKESNAPQFLPFK